MGAMINPFTGQLMPKPKVGIPGVAQVLVPFVPAPLIRNHPAFPVGLTFKVNPVTYRAVPSLTPEQVFNQFSTAFSAPYRTYYLDMIGGNNANNGLSAATAFKSWGVMQTAANATGQPCKCIVIRVGTSSIFGREDGPAGSPQVMPTVDMAYVARGGYIDCSTHNQSVIFTAVPGKPGCYYANQANVHMVTQRTNDTGEVIPWRTMEPVATIDDIYGAEGTFYPDTANSLVYFHTFHDVVPTNVNLRILRPVPLFKCVKDVNIGFFCETGNDGWLMMGGGNSLNTTANGGGSVEMASAAEPLPANYKCLVAHRVITSHGFRGFTPESVHGLFYLFDCRGYFHGTDWQNVHITRANTKTLFMGINGFGRVMGQSNAQSAQHFTLHDTLECIGLSLCNDYDKSAGALIRNVQGSRGQSAYDTFGTDRGDLIHGGTVESAAIQIDGGCEFYVEKPRFKVGGSQVDIRVLATAVVKLNAPDGEVKWGGPGTLDPNWKPGTA